MPDKPVLRGWIHAAATPLALAATAVLACHAPTAPAVISTMVFALCAVTLFTISAVYHLGTWSPHARTVLRDVDHADILFLVAAGGVMYTLGGPVYGLKRPDPWPRVFGFHEIFHSLTVIAFTCQFIAVWLVVRGAGLSADGPLLRGRPPPTWAPSPAIDAQPTVIHRLCRCVALRRSGKGSAPGVVAATRPVQD